MDENQGKMYQSFFDRKMFAQIRSARVEDAAALLNIYRYYVEETAVSFEWEAPTQEEFEARIAHVLATGFPYLVMEWDGAIVGYAYAGAFVPRAAYRHCCELTIYLAPHMTHQGFGSILYQGLMAQLRQRGYTHFYACIGVPHTEPDPYITRRSECFHHKLGFVTCGRFTACGKKFGREYDMIWCGLEG